MCVSAASAPAAPTSAVSSPVLRRLLQAPSRAPRIASPTEIAALDDSEEEEPPAAAAGALPDDGEGEKPAPTEALKKTNTVVGTTDAAPKTPTAPPADKSAAGPASAASRSTPAAAPSSPIAAPAEDDEEDDQFPVMVGGGLGLEHSAVIKIGEHSHEGELDDGAAPAEAPAAAAAAAGVATDVPDVPPTVPAGSVPTARAGLKDQSTPVSSPQPTKAKPVGSLKSDEHESAQNPAVGTSALPHDDDLVAPVDVATPGHANAISLADEKAKLDALHKKEQEEEDAALGSVPLRPLPSTPASAAESLDPELEEEDELTQPKLVAPTSRAQPFPSRGSAAAAAAGSETPVASKPPAEGVPSVAPASDVTEDPTAAVASGDLKQAVKPTLVDSTKALPKPSKGQQTDAPKKGAVDPAPAAERVAPTKGSSDLSGPRSLSTSANDTKPDTKPANKKTLPTTQPKLTSAPVDPEPVGTEGELTPVLADSAAESSSAVTPLDEKAGATAEAKKQFADALAALQTKQTAANKTEDAAKTEAAGTAREAEAAAAADPLKKKADAPKSVPSGPVLSEEEEPAAAAAALPSGPALKAKSDSNSTASSTTTETATTTTTKPAAPKPIPAPTTPASPKPQPQPTKPVPPAVQPAPRLQEEDDDKSSAAAEAAAAGSGAVRKPDPTADPEAAVPSKANTTTTTAPTSKLPSCTLRDARLSFVGGDLRLYVKIDQTDRCVVSDDLELRASLSVFEASAPNRCTHVMRLSSTEIKQASAGDDGYVLLSADKSRSLVPDVRYNVAFASCPALAQAPQGCKPVTRSTATGSEMVMRPGTASGNGPQAVRIVTSTAEKSRAPLDPVLAGEELSRSIVDALLQSSSDAAASLRSLSVQRLLTTFVNHDDTDESRPHVHFDVLPVPAGAAFTGEIMGTAELAERMRCFLLQKTKAQDTAELKLIGAIVSIDQFDPCANPADAAACAIVRPPVAPVKPTPTPTPITPDPEDPLDAAPLSGPTQPVVPSKPSGPVPTAPVEEDPEEPDLRPTPPPKTPTNAPVAPVKPAPVSPVPISDDDEDLVGAASAEEIDAALARTSAPPASTGYADQLSELLGGLNPLYAMVLVGSILAVTFWALCLRGGSSDGPRRTETAAGGPSVDQPDEELGGVEMARGSSRHGGFAPLQNQDDDSSMSSANQPAPTLASVPSGVAFANEKEEGSASKFLISVLISIGIPSFGTAKYAQILKDNYLSRLDQLKQLDSGDWKRLGLPLVIEEALRKALLEHTNREGKFAVNAGAAGAAGGRAKGLDLKGSGAKKAATNSASKDSQLTHALHARLLGSRSCVRVTVLFCVSLCSLVCAFRAQEGRLVRVCAEQLSQGRR